MLDGFFHLAEGNTSTSLQRCTGGSASMAAGARATVRVSACANSSTSACAAERRRSRHAIRSDKTSSDCKQAFSAAVAALTSAERAMLRYWLIDCLTIDDIAVLTGGHRSTAARRLGRIRDRLLARAHGILRRQLRVGADELESILRTLRSDLDLSLERLLQSSSS